MKALIVEDEINACQYLRSLINQLRPEYLIIDHLEGVQETINWLHAHPAPDVIFMDIQLSDGISFEIFNHIEVRSPIIFTTAYDQFAIQAFKHNSIDYLLKPINQEDLENALCKLENATTQTPDYSNEIKSLTTNYNGGVKNRCLVKKGNHFEFINVDDIAFINSDESITFLYCHDGKRHIYTKTIQVLIAELDTSTFFQINRKQIINIKAIDKIHPFLNQRLKIDLLTATDIDFVVSRARMTDFKEWIDS